MACWYPKIKSMNIFDNEYTILFVVSSSLAPHVKNRTLLLNFRMTRRYPKIFVHENYKFKILQTQKFPDLWYTFDTQEFHHTTCTFTWDSFESSSLTNRTQFEDETYINQPHFSYQVVENSSSSWLQILGDRLIDRFPYIRYTNYKYYLLYVCYSLNTLMSVKWTHL